MAWRTSAPVSDAGRANDFVPVSSVLGQLARENYPGIPDAEQLLAAMADQARPEHERRAASERLVQLGRERVMRDRAQAGGPRALRNPDVWEEAGEAKARDVAARREGLIAYTLPELLAVRFPARRALLCRGDVPVFREGHLGEVHGPRGFGKTLLLQTLAVVAATDVEVLGFRAPEPRSVLIVDGEMASEEVQSRLADQCDRLSVAPPANVTVIGADWQAAYLPRLDTVDGQAAIEPFVAKADLIIADNRSCLFDPDSEKDPGAWQPAQDWLLSLRRRGKGVLLAHHSNRLGGARGHSKPEDAMNLVLKLSRPEGYVQDQGARFLLEFEKARGFHGPAAAPFIATLTQEGWRVDSASQAEEDTITRKLIDHLVVANKVDERPRSASAAVRGAGVNRQAGLRAMADLLRSGRVVNQGGLRLA